MRLITAAVLVVALFGCAAPKPVSVVTGEACWRCRQPITDRLLAGQLVAPSGLASKFRTVHCMSTWIGQQKTDPRGAFYVTDHETGRWIRAERASYVRTIVSRNTMARDFVAFADRASAEAVARIEQAPIETWDDVLALGRTAPIGGN